MSLTEQVEFYKLLLKVLPQAPVRLKKAKSNPKRNVLGDAWNQLLCDVYAKILELYESKPMDKSLLTVVAQVVGEYGVVYLQGVGEYGVVCLHVVGEYGVVCLRVVSMELCAYKL